MRAVEGLTVDAEHAKSAMDYFVRMAQVQTTLDAAELLAYLRTESSSTHHQRIDDMILRLTTMAQSFGPAVPPSAG